MPRVAGHSKPIGSTCSMTWQMDEWDRMPELLDYFQTDAGTLYRVVGVIEGRTRVRHVLERVAHFELGWWLYRFYWLPRDQRRV